MFLISFQLLHFSVEAGHISRVLEKFKDCIELLSIFTYCNALLDPAMYLFYEIATSIIRVITIEFHDVFHPGVVIDAERENIFERSEILVHVHARILENLELREIRFRLFRLEHRGIFFICLFSVDSEDTRTGLNRIALFRYDTRWFWLPSQVFMHQHFTTDAIVIC